MGVKEKVQKMAEKLEDLEKENKELRKKNQELENKIEKQIADEEQTDKSGDRMELSRRQFMKMLGIGAGGLALSSAASGVGWSVLQPQSSGVSDIKAETATAAAGNFDLQGNSLTDTTQGFLDFTGDGNNLRIATGQAIEDGGGNLRLSLSSNATELRNDAQQVVISAYSGASHNIKAYSGTPVGIRDANGGFDALKYNTSSTAPGTLELTNAKLDLSPASANLRLATGKAIEDGGGTERVKLKSGRTEVYDDSGTLRLRANSGGNIALDALSNDPIAFVDQAQNGSVGLKYIAGSNGRLEMTNALLDMQNNGSAGRIEWPNQDGSTSAKMYQNTNGEIRANDDDGNTVILT